MQEDVEEQRKFWSSVDLTGNQTLADLFDTTVAFWSSVDLTGNQTRRHGGVERSRFWSSVDLTGNQTKKKRRRNA